MTYRTLLLAPVTVLAVAALAGSALAGTDSDDENGAPVSTPAPAPFIQPPAPAPVDAPLPAAAPEQVPVQTLVPGDHVNKAKARPKAKSKAKAKAKAKLTTPARHRTVKGVKAAKASRAAFPRGGVQAGFGGTA